MPDIYQKINAIMRELPAIGKDKQNKQQGFAYRGIDDVMNALFPLLAKHGVFVVPEVLSKALFPHDPNPKQVLFHFL